MKKSFRLLFLPIVVLAALSLNACSGVQAAQGSQDSGFGSNLNDLSLTGVPSTTSVNSSSAVIGTATPDISGTPDGTETPDIKETPSASETPDAQHDAQHELAGTVSAMDATTITINGVVYQLADLPAFAATLKVGDQVKVEFITNADGTVIVREITISSGSDSTSLDGNSNSSDLNSNDHNVNGNSNSNEANSNDSQHDANSNETEQHDISTVAPVIATP